MRRNSVLAVLLAAFFAAFGIVGTQGAFAGTFAPVAGELNESRYWDPVVFTLQNGKVLIAMGGDSTDQKKTAELFDPATGTFTPTGSLKTPRTETSRVLLNDGRVLVTGGFGNYQCVSVSFGETCDLTELYDPQTELFTETGSLKTARYSAAATILDNGKVLVVGGQSSVPGSPQFKTAELYDPAAGVWNYTGSMAEERVGPAIANLPDGRVLVAGGGNRNASLKSAEIYNPATGTFTATGSMPDGMWGADIATTLKSGKVLIVNSNGQSALFDPTTGTFTTSGTMQRPGALDNQTLLPDGNVLYIGASTYDATNSAELYDPATGSFAPAGSDLSPMAERRGDPAVALLDTGKVLVAGGHARVYGQSFLYENMDAELFDPEGTDPRLTAKASGTGTGEVVIMAEYFPGVLMQARSCKDSCSQLTRVGARAQVIANADRYSTFKGWFGVCAGSGSTCELTMSQSQQVTANFEADDLNLPPPPEPTKPEIAIPKVTPKVATVKRGKKATFNVEIQNSGWVVAKSVKVCATGSKTFLSIGKCVDIPSMYRQTSKRVTFAVKLKKTAKKGKTLPVTFTGTATGAAKVTAKATIKAK